MLARFCTGARPRLQKRGVGRLGGGRGHQRLEALDSLGARAGVTLVVLVAVGAALSLPKGLEPVLQVSVNGLATGAYLALGAVGLTFVYGILRLMNFAHGDFLTFGAYMALLLNVTVGAPLLVAILFGVVATALLSVALEFCLWRPLRRRGAAGLQLVLATIGLAFLIRYTIQLIAGPDLQQLDVNVTSSYTLFAGVRIGRTILIAATASYVILLAIGLILRYTPIGKQMRALADNSDLAQTTGINTRRLITLTWALGGGLAGLAGAMYVASIGSFDPEFGFTLLLAMFAAILIGGAGNPYGALLGGVVIGLAQEWSTLFIEPGWKIVVGFAILLLTLLVRPEGIFSPAGRL